MIYVQLCAYLRLVLILARAVWPSLTQLTPCENTFVSTSAVKFALTTL